MIIDCHVHVNNYADESRDALRENLDKLLATMRRNRVDISLILTSYKVVPGRPSTRAVVEATRDNKNLYVVAGLSYVDELSGQLDELREYLQDGQVRGLKLYPGYQPFYPNDARFEPAFELAAEFHVPVMIHTGDTYAPRGKVKYSHPLHVDELAVDHPDVNFIICHLGNPWIRDTMEVVYKNANAYTDISGLVLGDFNDRFEKFMRKQLEEMLLFGVEPGNVLYGTDWPISSMETYVAFMEELRAPNSEKRKIMYANAARLFRLSTDDSELRKGSLLDKFR